MISIKLKHVLAAVLMLAVTSCHHKPPMSCDGKRDTDGMECPCGYDDPCGRDCGRDREHGENRHHKSDKHTVNMTPEQMNAHYQKYSMPGENHKALEKYEGNWTYTSQWWKDAGALPETSSGSGAAKLILGKRYLQQEFKGIMGGQPFEGLGIMGYDNHEEQYVSFWIDNMGTGMMKARGHYDPVTKIYSEEGTFACPMRGSNMPYRATIKWSDDNSYVYEMYDHEPDGKEYRTLEIVYKRVMPVVVKKK